MKEKQQERINSDYQYGNDSNHWTYFIISGCTQKSSNIS